MVIGVLRFELLIHGASSLKDKRRVVKSLKDRLHREHLVSVAEIDRQDAIDIAVLGVSVVATDGKQAAGVLDRIAQKLVSMTDAELGESERSIIKPDWRGIVGSRPSAEPVAGAAADELASELLAYIDEGDSL